MLKNLLLLFIGLTVFSCSNAPKGEKAEVSEKVETTTPSTADNNFIMDANQSMARWEGTKPGGKHEGTIKIKSGSMSADASGLTGGTLMIDMNSMECTDLEGEKKSDLEGHLKSGDFFDVANFSTAKFEMTKITGVKTETSGATHLIYGNLTIKDITKQIGVKAIVKVGETVIAIKVPAFKIDRTDFGIKYKSNKFFDNLKDKFINDEIALSLQIMAEKKS